MPAYHSKIFHVFVVIMFGFLTDALAEEAKPIALVGSNYGHHEVTSIIRNILDHEDWVFENRGGFLPAHEFSKYAIVVIAHSQDRPYSAEEIAQIRHYLEQGGQLALIQQAPNKMADPVSQGALGQLLGMKQQKIRETSPEEAITATDSVLKGVTDHKRPSWISGSQGVANLDESVEVLIGNPFGEALVARRNIGKGRVYYLGNELFRLRLTTSPHREDSDSYITLFQNILTEATPLTLKKWQSQQASDWNAQGKRFLLWNREWQRGTEHRAIFIPPLPSENELINKLSVTMALQEQEAVQLNLTDLGKGGRVTWKIDRGGLPEPALTLFVQDKPNPIPWPKNPAIAKESPFWLMPPKALNAEAQDATDIHSGETRIFWLKFNSFRLKPGKYVGNIEFFVDDVPAGKVHLDVHIYPLLVPQRRQITVQPFGHVYGDVNNAAPALRFKRNLQDHGFEWSLINTLRPETFLVNRAPLTPQSIKVNLAQITSPNPPLIDFSSMDAFIDAALKHNLTYFRVTQNITESINALCKRLKLSDGETKAVRQWYLKAFARYLEDKGIRHYYASMGDEMSANELRDRFIPWSNDLAEAGWKSTSSFTTSVISDKELTDELTPTVGAWTLNRLHIPKFTSWIREGSLQLPPETLVGTYGAGEGRGSEIRKNASESRMIGWETWALEADYCAPNPYFKGWIYYADYRADRGIGGERFVAYLDMNDLEAPLVNSPFIEGIRESMEEANLASAMSWYLKALGDQVPLALQERARKILTHDRSGILQWQPRSYGQIESQFIEGSREDFKKAKAEVMDVLLQLQPLAENARLKPDLFWNQISLTKNGAPMATIIGNEETEVIQDAIQKLIGKQLPTESKALPAKGTAIFVGTTASDFLPANIKAKLGPHLEDASWIREIQDGERKVIWVGGTSPEMVHRSVEQFVCFLRAPYAVFIKQPPANNATFDHTHRQP